MASTTMLHVRVDEQIKAQATQTLAAMGLTISDAVRVFLMRVLAGQQMPFALKAPNVEIRAASRKPQWRWPRPTRLHTCVASVLTLLQNCLMTSKRTAANKDAPLLPRSCGRCKIFSQELERSSRANGRVSANAAYFQR